MKKLIILLTILLPLFHSCFWMNTADEEFFNTKTHYRGSEIKTNGYYYSEDYDNFTAVLILFRDGVAIQGIGVDSLIDFENRVISGKFNENISVSIEYWGLYIINSSEIILEAIESVGWTHRISFLYYGEILNDTTIHFYAKKETYSDAEKMIFDETYHYKKFSPKPDSTNSFIN